VIRKHTRRAAKAAFAISLGVAIVIGGTATAAPRSAVQAPTVVIGTKNFTEQYILGQLYKQALEAKGFKVSYKENIGSSEIIDTALTSGKINFYPEYVGVIVLNLARQPGPKSARATFLAAKRFEQRRGFTLLSMTPFADSDTFTVLRRTATKYDLTSIGDVKKVPNASFAGYPECRTRITCYVGMRRIYGLTKLRFVSIGSIPVTKLIDTGKVTGGDIFSTEPALANRRKYVVLDDTKAIFGFQNVAPVVSRRLVAQLGPRFTSVVNAVSKKLSQRAMIAMNKAVGVDKRPAAVVARAFLRANKLA
jgi:osmoprotectant transport system substrate-binding protein